MLLIFFFSLANVDGGNGVNNGLFLECNSQLRAAMIHLVKEREEKKSGVFAPEASCDIDAKGFRGMRIYEATGGRGFVPYSERKTETRREASLDGREE